MTSSADGRPTSGGDLLDLIDQRRLRVGRLSRALSRITGSPRRPSPRTRYNLACHLATSDVGRCLEILGDDSRREPHPWAAEDPVLAGVRQGPLGPTMRAALRRGRSGDPPGALSRLDSIGTTGAEQLNRAGVYAPGDLLGAAGPKESRARLAKRLTRDDAQLKEWAGIAELALAIEAGADAQDRTPALDIANLLALTGISSCASLASTKGDVAISALAGRLTRMNRAHCIIDGSKVAKRRHAVTISALTGWISAAKRALPTRVEPPDPPAAPPDKKLETVPMEVVTPRGAEAGESE